MTTGMTDQPLMLRVLAGETPSRPPVWFMRQAGRYLPEYRALRARAPDFVSFCLNPEMAAEATLQPMRRFPFDASIVFADILLVPKALGQEVRFEVGEGPRLGALPDLQAMRDRAAGTGDALAAVGETLQRVKAGLPAGKTLIGFCGAPWTVATYRLDGESRLAGKGERADARTHFYADPEGVDALLAILVEASADYLAMQVRSGAQVLQIFESWASGLPDALFQRLVVQPNAALVAAVRARGVDVPIITFPRAASGQLEAFAAAVPSQGLGLDTAVPLALGRKLQGSGKVIQGALDPLVLRAGGPQLDAAVEALLGAWGAGPYVFNLGHGILPDTPVAHVEQVLARVTGKGSLA